MTRKQLESIIRFSSVFNDPANDISVVNEQYGLELTEATSPSQAVTAYLEAKGIRLEGERVGANPKLTRLTEMSGDHFEQIFTKGFAPSKIKSDVAKMNSLFGFHDLISMYGHFEFYRTASELNYDVEFTLDR